MVNIGKAYSLQWAVRVLSLEEREVTRYKSGTWRYVLMDCVGFLADDAPEKDCVIYLHKSAARYILTWERAQATGCN
jgi:hypothetical protein